MHKFYPPPGQRRRRQTKSKEPGSMLATTNNSRAHIILLTQSLLRFQTQLQSSWFFLHLIPTGKPKSSTSKVPFFKASLLVENNCTAKYQTAWNASMGHGPTLCFSCKSSFKVKGQLGRVTCWEASSYPGNCKPRPISW